MKKLLCILLSALMIFLTSFSAFAWSVPEDIGYEDEAKIYFAEVISSYPSENSVVVKPIKTIKGNVPLGKLHIVRQCFKHVVPGNVYIFLTVSENFQDTYVFTPTSYDTDTLSFSRVDGNNDRLIKYINQGDYKHKDDERINRLNNELKGANSLKLSELLEITPKKTDGIVTAKNKLNDTYDIDNIYFYSLCEEITVYEIKDHGIYSDCGQMIFYTDDNAFTITSDAKIITSDNSFYAEYFVSAEDRDKLLSLVTDEKLPTINKGSMITVISVLCIVLSIVLTTGICTAIFKKKKKKS